MFATVGDRICGTQIPDHGIQYRVYTIRLVAPEAAFKPFTLDSWSVTGPTAGDRNRET
jgi:hypothetical protein